MYLPIAERELRVNARMPKMYRGRVVTALIFCGTTLWLLWIGKFQQMPAQWAGQVFTALAYIALLMCMFASSGITDSISGEKRNGTLGLLFLTNLKGIDIIVGKLAASGLNFIYALLGVLPIMSIPVLLGGVSGESLFKTAVTLINALFFSLSVGLWVSTKSWDQKRALNAGVWVSILFLWGFPGIGALLHARFGWSGVREILDILSPFYQVAHASPFGGTTFFGNRYWTSVLIIHALAWIALARACHVLPREWQDRDTLGLKGRWKELWHNFRFGGPITRVEFRRRLLDKNALHWLSSREKFAPLWTWSFLALVCAGWVGAYYWIQYTSGTTPDFWAMGIGAIIVLIFGLRMRTIAFAGDVIARDRFSGALELLLSTTLREKDVAMGQQLTFFRVMLAQAIATVGIMICVFTAMLARTIPDEQNAVWLAMTGLPVLFISDLIASFWTGMWMACISKTAASAPGAAIARLLALPWVVFFLLVSSAAFMQWNIFQSFESVFVAWFSICFINNIIWIKRSRRRFLEQLRIAASERYQPPVERPWWNPGRLLRQFGLSGKTE